MQTTTAERVIRFKHGNTEEVLPDLNPAQPVEEVVKMLAVNRPELATSVVEGPIQDGQKILYHVRTQLGYKG